MLCRSLLPFLDASLLAASCSFQSMRLFHNYVISGASPAESHITLVQF